ncbi:hypothetical protein LTR95_002133 [Oleoguttula sp. CCFEE 5521]
MPLKSDLAITASKLDPGLVTEQTKKFNSNLIALQKSGPKWYEVGAAKYRPMRWNGETPFPAPKVLDRGKNITLPSRNSGREIPCRVFAPSSGQSKGVFYHIHGGGWVLQSEAFQDPMLAHYADSTGLTVVSVGYRLAPEDPYPAGNEDCFDVGQWLVDNAEKKYGGPLQFVSGDSAGAHLSVCTAFELLQTRPKFAFRGLVLNFGCYDLAGMLPAAHLFDLGLILDKDIMDHYLDAYLPGKSEKEKRDPKISPFFADLSKLKLPPALFTCGTLDPLLDDSIMFCTRWVMAGGEGVLKLYPGAPHGFNFFPLEGTEQTQIVLDDIATFVKDHSP